MTNFDQRTQDVYGYQYNVGGNLNINFTPRKIDPGELEAAQQHLAKMPLDTVPAPAPLPEGSWMPFSKNPHFIGRGDDLKVLAKIFKREEQPATIGQVVVVTGIGGIGKTQLVSEFVHCYGQYFAGGVFWLSFTDPANIKAQVAECGLVESLNLWHDFSKLDIETKTKLVRTTWQEPIPRLLIFDNCEDEALLADLRPPTGGARVLVTSRRGIWSQTLGIITWPLGVLSRTESITLLHKFRPDLAKDDSGLDAIAGELGNLPLALHLAGSFLKRYQYAITPSVYLAQLRDESLLDHLSLQGRDADFSPTEHELHVAKTFALSYDRLDSDDETDRLALSLLARAAYFAPGEPIPRKLLYMTLSAKGTWAQANEVVTTKIDFQTSVKNLLAQLAESEKHMDDSFCEWLVTHNSLTEDNTKAISQLADSLNRLAVAIKEALARLQDFQTIADELHTEMKTYLIKTQQIIDQVSGDLEINLQIEDALIRLNNLGLLETETEGALHLHPLLATFVRARTIDETAQTAVEETLLIKTNHLYNAGRPTSLLPLQSHLRFVINLAKARRDKQVAGLCHAFGGYLYMLGDYYGAKGYFEQALAIYLESFGEMHFQTASVYNSLGLLLRHQEDWDNAQVYLQKALNINEAVLRKNHPLTVKSLHNLGMLLYDRGELTRAQSYIEQALEIRLERYGEIHRETANSFTGLGLLLMSQGNLQEARVYLEKALTIRLEVVGKDHPEIAQSFNHLIQVRLAQRDKDIVWIMEKEKQAVAIFEAQYGSDHPTTRLLQNNVDTFEEALVNEVKRRLTEGSLEEVESLRQIILDEVERHSTEDTTEEKLSS